MARKGGAMLNEAEDAIDAALSTTAALTSGLYRMRLDSDLSAVIGQDALTALAKSMSLLTEARGAIVDAHGHLAGVRTKIGCATVASGNDKDKGDDVPVTPPKGLRQVA